MLLQFNNVFEDTANNAAPLSYIKFTTLIQPAPQAYDIEVCVSDNNVFLMASGNENGTIRWYDQPTLNEENLIFSGYMINLGILDYGEYNYYVTDYLNGFESDSSFLLNSYS